MKHKFFVHALTALLLANGFSKSMQAGELPKNEALRDYWEAYEAYTKKRNKAKQSAFQESIEKLMASESIKDRSRLNNEIELLRKAIDNYKEQLKNLPDSSSVPETLLNLSIALNDYANTLEKMNEDATFQRQEIVQLIQEHLKQFADDDNHDKAQYFLANNLEMTDQKERAYAVWKNLAESNKNNIYAVHANIIIADHYFESDVYEKSIYHLNKAVTKQNEMSSNRFDPLNSQIYYRLAWSNYRAGRLEEAVSNCEYLLKPSAIDVSGDIRQKIRQDVITLTSNALYEMRDINKIKKFLLRRELETIAGELTLKTVEKFQAVEDHKTVDLVISSMRERLSLDPVLPLLLANWSSSLDHLGLIEEKIDVLEDLAVLLPTTSLWRSRNSTDKTVLSKMEDSGRWAATAAASWHMERGFASGKAESFNKAEHFYSLLQASFPMDPKVNDWAINKAKSQLHGERLAEAYSSLKALSKNLTLSADQLETVLYTGVVSSERLWRKSFAQALDERKEPSQDPKTLADMSAFQDATLNYSNKYPKQSRSTDLILAAASAWRDLGNFQKARDLWERVLLSKSGRNQRVLAIRGLVFAPIAQGRLQESVETISKFLKLEDWKNIGQPFRTELEKALSYAVENYQSDLVSKGKHHEAADLLLSMSTSHKAMPKADKFYRDGAYYQAMAGKWLAAEESAKNYLDRKSGKFRGDMMYLEARAQEYQLKFAESAKTYLALAQSEGSHNKSSQSVERAISLANANNDLETQAKAIDLAIYREKKTDKKYALLLQGAKIQMDLGNNQAASKLVDLAKSTATVAVDRYNAEIIEAKILLDNQQFDTAKEKIAELKKRADLEKGKLGRAEWGEIVSKASLALADEEHKKFASARINHANKDIMRALAIKTEIFENLSQLYSSVIETNSEEFSPEARFRLAEAAEELQTDIEMGLQEQEKSLPFRDQERIKSQSLRLENITKALHADNAIVGTRDPAKLGTNPWLRKSWLRINAGKVADSGPSIPTSIRVERPNEWSL